jgi:hypothetical protein
VRELEMDDRYRPEGDISLSEDTARILLAGGQTWDGDEEEDDDEPVNDDFGEVHAGLSTTTVSDVA